MYDILQDLAMLRSCLLEDEMALDESMSDESRQIWERLLREDEDAGAPNASLQTTPAFPLTLLVKLSDAAILRIAVSDASSHPSFSTSHTSRSSQERLQDSLDQLSQASNGEEFPIFFTVTSMQEHVSTMAEANEHESREPIATASPVKVQPTRVETKCALLWSHHLLAMSKRKDIQHWSVELKLWSLTKIGYPGVIVVEGIKGEVDEFLRRIKALQWYALQVRYEDTTTHQDADEDAVLATCALRKAVEADGVISRNDKPHGYETHEMSELAAIMRKADLGEIFATSMKLPT